MKRNSRIGIIILMIILSIGFAAVTTNLIINGAAIVGINPSDFDIYFSFAKAEQGGTATISDDGKVITYSTKLLTKVNDKARLDYTVTNNSSNYDANVVVGWNAVDTISGKDYSSYYSVTRTGFDTGIPTTVEAKTSVDGSIVITLIKPILEEVEIETTMTFDATPTERTLKGEGSPLRRRTLAEMIMRDNAIRTDTPDLTITSPKTIYTATFNSTPTTVDMTGSNGQDLYYTYSDSYEFAGTTTNLVLKNPKICKWSECYNDLIGKYIVSPVASTTYAQQEITRWPSQIYKVTPDTTIDTLSVIVSDYDTSYDYSASGFYSMDVTNGFGGQSEEGTTYYFRGKVDNNYVAFGEWPTGVYIGRFNDYPDYVVGKYSTLEECQHGSAYGKGVDYCETEREPGAPMLWRVVRINEDGTVRLIFDYRISENKINDSNKFTNDSNDQMGVYYSNSILKNTIEEWYNNTITGAAADRVASGNYFCESARVKSSESYNNVGNASMVPYKEYTPDLTCPTDGNGKGLVNSNVALATYDEVVLAGGYYEVFNYEYYINDYKLEWWTMSPAGERVVWRIDDGTGHISQMGMLNYHDLRPVINIKADTYAHGTGTKDDPYVIELD